MKASAGAAILALLIGAGEPAVAQRTAKDAGGETNKPNAAKPADKKAPKAKKAAKKPPPSAKKTGPADERTKSDAARKKPQKAKRRPKAHQDQEVIEHLEMLLLLDLLSDYELFDEADDATLSAPGGLKEYRP